MVTDGSLGSSLIRMSWIGFKNWLLEIVISQQEYITETWDYGSISLIAKLTNGIVFFGFNLVGVDYYMVRFYHNGTIQVVHNVVFPDNCWKVIHYVDSVQTVSKYFIVFNKSFRVCRGSLLS